MSSSTTGNVLSSQYGKRLEEALRAARILTGALDEELGISKAKANTAKLRNEESRATLQETLSDRFRHSMAALADSAPPLQLQDDVELSSGELALDLLITIHKCLVNKKQDQTSRVAVSEGVSRYADAREDVGLGIKDVKLVTTLQSLVSRWVFATQTRAYDAALVLLQPQMYSKSLSSQAPQIDDDARFQEIKEVDEQQLGRQRTGFAQAREALAESLDRWASVLVASQSDLSSPISASTDVATVLLRLGVSNYVSSLLRIGFGPTLDSLNASTQVATKDRYQLQAAQKLAQLLRFMSTTSAMSTLSTAMSHTVDNRLGNPFFARAVASRLLTAQLLRPDGVRSLLMSTFAESTATAEANDGDESAAGGNILKKLEQVAQLLLTPPKNMPTDMYMSIILSSLIDVLVQDPDTKTTPPPPEQLRAAGFTLTRISRKQPTLFRKALDRRIYAVFSPLPSVSGEVVSPKALEQSLSLLSSLLLFSEPSPDFYTALIGPILPQMLSLADFLSTSAKTNKRGKVRSLDTGKQLDDMRKEVDDLLHTWTRLVDAEIGSKMLLESIIAVENGIGSPNTKTDTSEGDTFFWKEETNGIAVWYGTPPPTSSVDLSTLLNDLSFSSLAQKSTSAQLDRTDDVPILPDNLSASLGMQPNPAMIVSLLKKSSRKDLAQFLLPLVLDTYMSSKVASQANMLSSFAAETTEARSVLFLQLILQLFDAFGSDLLQGKNTTTLAFIDFSLSAPGTKRQPEAEQTKEGEAMPFLTAASNTKSESSIFNVGGNLVSPDLESRIPAGESELATEDDEELIKTALTLLLSLLEGDTELSTGRDPMLVVIESKIDALLDSQDAEIRSLSKEAKLVLTARRNAFRLPQQTNPTSKKPGTLAHDSKYKQAHETYQEALKLLQDPILPVRAHGLVLLRRLVSDNKEEGGQAEHLDPALLPAILDIFLQAIQDDESYLYLNAVQGLGALASSGGQAAISRLVEVYVGRNDRLTSIVMSTREVEKRLRVGEALLQVVQRSGDALQPSLSILVSPLLSKLRDRSLPTVLRSSFLSILGTAVEAVPPAMAVTGFAAEIAEICMDILRVETVHRPATKRESVKMNVQGEEQTPEDDDARSRQEADQLLLDSATTTNTKVAHLRRAALLALILLVRGTRYQLDEDNERRAGDGRPAEKLTALRMPGGSSLPHIGDASTKSTNSSRPSLMRDNLLFPLDRMTRLRELTAYVQAKDDDSFVRAQAHDCATEVEELTVQLIASGLGL